MRIAAIDIGTNSIHMIVVQVGPGLSFETIDREKVMIRLGAGGLGGRALTETAMTAALQTLVKFRRLADSHRVDEIVAAATSAVREAPNGAELLAAIEQQTGIHVIVISGTEEARLIHLAAMYGVAVGSGSAVVIDIGGGSTEITLGTSTNLQLARTTKLGVIRLAERFVRSDPLSGADERRLVRHISERIHDAVAAIHTAGFEQVVGTSGTIMSVGAMITGEALSDEALHHREITERQIHKLRKRIIGLDLDERLHLSGLDPRRADLIVAGVVLLDTIVRRLEADRITLCDYSLREGLVLDFIQRNASHIAQADRYPEIRRRSVYDLGERCSFERPHAEQVARLALSLFEQTRGVHGLPDRVRDWLEYAGLLHDVGMHISHDKHHRHSYYLIKNGGLRGFTPDEVETIALIARYHRRASPKRAHEGFSRLRESERRGIRALAAVLRVAESLDRSHAQVIDRVSLVDRGRYCSLTAFARGDAELEAWATGRQLGPLEELIGKEVRLETRNATDAEHADHPTPLPGQALRGRGHRRVRQDDAARVAGKVADGRRPARLRH
jgi:exopolyphosphatase/guanosine-5'-triphosphate,3'-diphosphate pyrophosphatase